MTKSNLKKSTRKLFLIIGSIFFILIIAFFVNLTIWHRIEQVQKREHKFLPGENSITWIGHSTVLLHLDKVNIITDPMYSDFILIFAKRYFEPGLEFETLPHIDAIVISHEHYDHFDKATLKRFNKNTPIIISYGLGERLKEIGFSDVRELKWWKSTRINGTTITAVPARHGEAKVSSYVVEGSKTVFFAGDTAFFEAFNDIGRKFDIDVALMPISNYKLRSGIKWLDNIHAKIHMSPADFPEAIKALHAGLAVPIHFGTFRNEGFLELPLEEPPRCLREVVKKNHLENKVKILDIGEQFEICYPDGT
jgi:L-ascorbate metabolism protein UlaG (beta-lactamase superfamily)